MTQTRAFQSNLLHFPKILSGILRLGYVCETEKENYPNKPSSTYEDL